MSLPIGSRVRVTGDVVSHLKGGRYDGALATVVNHSWSGDLNHLKFDDKGLSNAGTWSDPALVLVTLPKVGEAVTRAGWNDLPLGTVLVDQDGWEHTKIADVDYTDEGDPVHAFTTTWRDPSTNDTGEFYSCWNWNARIKSYPTETQEVTTVSDTPNRPLIDFSGSSRATARSYASDLVSRVNKPETNDVLRAVANGQQVDAYALAEALLDAQRHVATRFGQSMQRRREGEKAAHLGYIAHAVLANHADGLPVYESGQRSRKIEELEAEVADLRASVKRANETLAETAADLEREAVKHASTIENLIATDEAWNAAKAEAARLRAIHAYAYGLLSETDRARVQGFEDGYDA